MRRGIVLALALVILTGVGLVLGQTSSANSFSLVAQIGELPPNAALYEPINDQFLLSTLGGALQLFDAAPFERRTELYGSGSYNAFDFSRDGRLLAVAVDRRVELWDALAGTLLLTLEPDGANLVIGPLMFSEDGSYLLFTAVVPASQETRRSENDTDLLPWVWDLNEALDIGESRLPGRVTAYSFFDYRTGNLYLGPNNTIVAARPGLYELIDLAAPGLPVVAEVASTRFEEDPVSLWTSASGEAMYFTNDEALVQVDTRTKKPIQLPIGRSLDTAGIDAIGEFLLSPDAQIIGEPNSRTVNPLVRDLFGYDYRADYNYHPLTVTLLDVLQPETEFAGTVGVLLYVFDDATGYGTVEFIRPGVPMAVDGAGTTFAKRANDGGQTIDIYDLTSGRPRLRFTPTSADVTNGRVFAFDGSGEVLVAGYGRYDATTGAPIDEQLQWNSALFQPGTIFFSDDSRSIHTYPYEGGAWWSFDIETRQPTRREPLQFGGSILDVWRDGSRFLLDVTTGTDRVLEVNDIGTGQRQRLTLETPPNMTPFTFAVSPSWRHVLVTFTAAPNSLHYPNGAIGLYTFGEGPRWFIAGDDLPDTFEGGLETYWLDDETVYVVGTGAAARPTVFTASITLHRAHLLA